jgi:hypothetical protein
MTQFLRVAAIVAAVCLVGACGKPKPAPAPAASYEAVFVPGSPQVLATMLRINVTTGQTVTGVGAPAQMVAIPDLTLPEGQYHLHVWSQPAAGDGSVSWGAGRVDNVSGRVWILSGGGQTPFNWIELTPPK